MTAEFDWWLLILGLVVGAGIVWLVLAELPRRDAEMDAAELETEAGWIAANLASREHPVDAAVARAVLGEHRAYLRLPPPDEPDATLPVPGTPPAPAPSPSGPAASGGAPPLIWLSAADVLAALPPLEERLRLAELTMTALTIPGGSQLPPKVEIHPGPAGSLADAMPAWLRGAEGDPAADLLGLKWVTVFPTNQPIGIPAIGATVVINDPTTGVPVAILDGGPVTAHRTAAVSGVILRRWAPSVEGRPARVGLIGAGAQGRSHLPVLGGVLPGCQLTVYDVDAARAEDLAGEARRTAGIGAVEVAADARSAVRDADVVVTAASFGPVRQVMTPDWLAETVTVVPVDYATYCSAELARTAALWMVDERAQFLAKREEGHFDGYPDPVLTIGKAILEGTPRPDGRVVGTHLGVGLADLIFGEAIVREARRRGLGQPLPR